MSEGLIWCKRARVFWGRGLGGARRGWRSAGVIVAVLLMGVLGGCASNGDRREQGAFAGAADGSDIPDAVPRAEPLSRSGNPDSYAVRGKRYFTLKTSEGHVERGLASWYGRQFHGRKTSSGERYDMYAMTAAHKTLPLPTYVRVTNMENGRTAVVKVNDRGPFHGPRVIDLSYSAAKKLGVIEKGTAMVEVRAIDPTRPANAPGPFLAAKATPKVNLNKPVAQPRPVSKAPPEPEPSPALAAVAPVDVKGEAEQARALDSALAAAEHAKPAVEAPLKAPPVAASAPAQGLYLQVGAFGDPSNAERLRKRLVANLKEPVRVHRAAAGEPSLYKVRIGPLGSEGEAKVISAKLVTLGVEPPRRVWN
jgi:peptidoglycan lytic transglycosylase